MCSIMNEDEPIEHLLQSLHVATDFVCSRALSFSAIPARFNNAPFFPPYFLLSFRGRFSVSGSVGCAHPQY